MEKVLAAAHRFMRSFVGTSPSRSEATDCSDDLQSPQFTASSEPSVIQPAGNAGSTLSRKTARESDRELRVLVVQSFGEPHKCGVVSRSRPHQDERGVTVAVTAACGTIRLGEGSAASDRHARDQAILAALATMER